MTAEQFRALWEKSGLTESEMAKQAGCDIRTIRRYKSQGMPKRMNAHVRQVLLRMAREYGVLKGETE